MDLLPQIEFGSDGWRGVFAREVTFGNYGRIVRALFDFLSRKSARPKALIGFDRRLMADVFAQNLARGFESLGGEAHVSSGPLPSPVLAWHTRKSGADIGVIITASHNPPEYLGLKLKENYGGSARPEVQKEIGFLATNAPEQDFPFDPRYRHTRAFRPFPAYLDAVEAAFADVLAASRNGARPPKCVADYMHGASAEVFPAALERLNVRAESLRENRDPLFGGAGPEPLPERLGALTERVRAYGGGAIGLAFDGDGDRLTVVDETGDFVQSRELFAIYLCHLARVRGETGRAVGSSSFSRLVDRAAAAHGVELLRVPVGFKAVSGEFVKGGVMLGGEESGGTGFGFWLPERDAIVMALLLLEAISAAGTSLAEMRAALVRDYGRLFFMRKDIPLSSGIEAPSFAPGMDKDALAAALPDAGGEFAGQKVAAKDGFDGVRLDFADGSWALFRLSGTEPLIRVYAESESETAAHALIAAAERLF